jgi:protein TonB
MAPARAAPAAGTPARDAAAAAVDGAWQQALGIWLAAHKTYPEQARRRGEEGRVAIRFTVNRSGRVLDVSVVGGSGSAALDAAASTLLRGAALPPFVASMPQEQVTVTVQLRYFLTP